MRETGSEQPLSVLTADRWEWGNSLDPVALRRMAQVSLELFQWPEQWIHRRVEYISFKNHELVHHQVSVDFTLPAGMPPVGKLDEHNVYIAPLFLLVKDPLQPLHQGSRARWRHLIMKERYWINPVIPTAAGSNFDFTDQHGRRQPLMTRQQSSLLAATLLLEAASRILGEPAHPLVAKRIEEIPRYAWTSLIDQRGALTWLLDDRLFVASDQRHTLRRNESFQELTWTLASHYIISCLFIGNAQQRSIYKLSYDQRANEVAPKAWGRLFRSLGLKSERYDVPLTEIGGGSSYHLEIEVPKELAVNAVGLTGKRYEHYSDLRSRRNQDYFIRQVERASEGKLFVPRPWPGRRVGIAWVKFRVRQAGFLVGALIAAIAVSGVLWATALVAPDVIRDKNAEAAVATILLIPAVIAAYVARPGEHAITARMLRVARIVLVLDAVMPGVAVFFLITNRVTIIHGKCLRPVKRGCHKVGHFVYVSSLTHIGLVAVASVSLIGVGLFALANWLPRPRGRTIYEPMPGQVEKETV